MKIIRGIFNRFVHLIARFSPGATTIRPFLHRLRGVKIYGRVFIGDDVYLENECPECIEIHDQAQICLRSTITAHLRGAGKVIIEKKVFIGSGCVIASAVGKTIVIGEGAVVSAGSVITENVAPFTMVAGVPAKPIAIVKTPMTLETEYDDFKKGIVPIKKR